MTRLIHARLRALRGTPESGIALVTVIAITAVLGILVVSAVAFSIGGMRKAQNGQEWNGAMAAAYAGVEEYQSQLSNDPAYGRYGNSASSFTGPGPALPPRPNPAFGLGKTGTWAKVSGSEEAATFRYEVDNSKLFTHGTLRLRSTGKVGSETRSVIVDLKQNGFGDYVYFTNFETSDPFNTASPCYSFAYDGRPEKCGTIAFGSDDVLDGPVHSNDRILIDCGATFNKPITTAYKPSHGEAFQQGAGGCRPNFFEGKAPISRSVLEMPPTNSEMKKEVRFDLPEEVPVPGCLYTGPTTIKFNADGTMLVKSPWTKKVQISATAGRDKAACGSPGTRPGQLGSSGGAKISVPDNNVIFVQNVPNVVGDPNSHASSVMDPPGACKGGENRNPVGYPFAEEIVPDTSSYQCHNGDVFVQGNLKGKLTVAAENNVYVVGNIAYADRERDVLGLVGQNSVIVHRPVRNFRDPWNRSYIVPMNNDCGQDRRIDASILSVAHTFTVQNTSKELRRTDGVGCSKGKLRVTGSIAQMFRGIVSHRSGYDKEYRYDSRLSYVSPPKFLSPANIVFGVSTWSEINPVMRADGSYA